MTKQSINVGATANDRKGDSLRAAFQKVNANFTELYDRAINTDAQTLTLTGNTLAISGGNTVDLSQYVPAIMGAIQASEVNIAATATDVNITAENNIVLNSASDTLIRSSNSVAILTDSDNQLHNFIFDADGYFSVITNNGGININNELNFMRSGSPTATLVLNDNVLELVLNDGFKFKDNVDNALLEYSYNETGIGIFTVTGIVIGTFNGAVTGDVSGSVFADDSTLLVDGVNGVVPASVISGKLDYNTVPDEYLRFPEPDVLVITPNPTSSGTKGEVIYVAGFVYICVATNIWVRAPVETAWE